MARPRKAEGIKFALAFLFVLFLIINGLFGFLWPITTIYYGAGDRVIVGPLDLPFGSRLLVFLVGVGVSWWVIGMKLSRERAGWFKEVIVGSQTFTEELGSGAALA